MRYLVIFWGNGIGIGLSIYVGLLLYWVSYGFVVVVAEIFNVGIGWEMLV